MVVPVMISRRLGDWWMVALLTAPWLNPHATGPTPNIWPWLVSAMCATLLWLQRHRLRVELIAFSWILAATVSVAIGLLQYFGLAQALHPWVSQSQMGEAFANLRQRNQYASLTNIALVALIWLVTEKRLAGPRNWVTLGIAALLAIGNAASSSRTGLAQLGLLCGLLWIWGGLRPPRARLVIVTAVSVYVLATLLLPWIAGFGLLEHGMTARLKAGDSVCASRLTLWSNVLTLIAQRPWAGWGWGQLDYAHFITLYPGPRFCEILDNAHNLPLHLAVELGIPVALAVCAGLGWIVWRMRPWRETDASRQMAWGVLATIGLHSLLEYPLWYGPFQIAFILCVGVLWVVPATGKPTQKNGVAGDVPVRVGGASSRRWPSQAAIAFGVMALLICIGIDYHRVSQIYLPAAERSAAYRDDTLNKVRRTWFFGNQADFAELSMTSLKQENAKAMYALAGRLVHYSPEPSVIEKLVESATLLHMDDEALFYLARYRAAFPKDHARWASSNVAP